MDLSAPTKERFYSNPLAKQWTKASPSSSSSASQIDPTRFHRSFPDYSPTPLVNLPSIASSLGVSHVLLKDESSRLGLSAFKILGASFAIFVALCDRTNLDPSKATFEDLVKAVKSQKVEVTIHAATDGNHGRAVARMAALLGIRSRIVVPASVSERSRNFISSETNATVVVHEGSYDEAVAAAALAADKAGMDALLIQDTSWEGYEKVPLEIVQGYRTLFAELDEQITSVGISPSSSSNTLVAVPVGVGSLAHSAVLHYRTSPHLTTSLLSVEPTKAPCVLTSLIAGTSTSITTEDTIMPGLNCGTPSPIAWSDLKAGIDIAVSVEDEEADSAVRELQSLGLKVGPCGAAVLAGVKRLLDNESQRKELGFGGDTVVVLICTEGSEVYLVDN